ncbi:CobW family GTP-binding protein [Cereibacter sphaeroides]|uniref:CobW family GTP-binding protein n=1 Tax=Cereibacter sphaeroides TaxID=1063 RepID=UPI00399083A1
MAEARRDGRLPLTLVGGFLGAGKSTWLRHQLHAGRFARHHLLVNEAAETPVDNLLLGGAARLTLLAGGCACCEGQAQLRATLRAICETESGPEAGGIEGILLETSGLADPGAIAAMLAADPVLVRRLALAETLVLVDAAHGAAQLATEPLARAQIEAAGRLVLTKPAAAPDLARLAATLRALAPEAELSAAERGVPVPLPAGAAEPYPLPPLAAAAPIRPHRLRIGAEGGWVALSTWLSALLQARGEDVVRVKGVVRTPAGRLLLQSVRRMVQPPEILPEGADLPGPAPEEGTLVLIGRNIDEDRLARSWELYGG